MQTFGDAASASSSASIPASVKVLPFLRPGKLTVPVRPTPWPAEGVEAAGRLGAEPEAEAPTLCPTLVPTLLPATQPAPPRSSLSPSAALEHDARSALTSLQLLTGLLAEPGVLPADHAQYVEGLEATTRSLGQLITDFAQLCAESHSPHPSREPAPEHAAKQVPEHVPKRVPTSKTDLKPRPTPAFSPAPRQASKPVSEALAAATPLLRAIAGPRVAVHVSSETKLPALAIPEDALERVFTNLVKNAAEAMPTGGTVTITARRALSRSAPAVLIHVSDNGPGIPSLALGRIFEPGFSSKNNGSVCGLGLAIVRQLVEASGGEVRVASTRRRGTTRGGTTFELRLPTRPSPSKERESVLP